jgi:hypothetical protein
MNLLFIKISIDTTKLIVLVETLVYYIYIKTKYTYMKLSTPTRFRTFAFNLLTTALFVVTQTFVVNNVNAQTLTKQCTPGGFYYCCGSVASYQETQGLFVAFNVNNNYNNGFNSFEIVPGTTPTWKEFSNGTAQLSMRVRQTIAPTYIFDYNMTFSGYNTTGPPHYSNDNWHCYPNRPRNSTLPQDQPNPQSGWYYYSSGTGNMVGVTGSAAAGVNLSMAIQMGVQIGIGAAGNCSTKLSVGTWLTFTEVSDPSNIITNIQNGGDLYIDLNSCTNPCVNVTNGGTIGSNQSGCSPFAASAFTSISAPAGANSVEYIWLKSTTSSIYNTTTASQWSLISGANTATYNPGSVTQTTWYIRCSRNAGCTDYVGESNILQIAINNCTPCGGCITAPNLLPNGGFEQNADPTRVSTSTWKMGGTSGSPVIRLNDQVTNDNRYMTDWAPGPTVYYVKKNAATNNPQGEHFIWLPNKDQCLVLNNGVIARADMCPGKQYTICFKAAAWRQDLVNFVPQNTNPAQSDAKVALEFFTNNSPTNVIAQNSWTLPASPSWSNLNWQTLSFTFTYDANNPMTQIIFSDWGATNGATDVGIAIDDIQLKEATCNTVCFGTPIGCTTIKAPSGICYGGNAAPILIDVAATGATGNYIIKPGTSPTFTRYSNGTARLQMVIQRQSDANHIFDVDITMTGENTSQALKRDADCSYPLNGSLLKYYSTVTGSLVGIGPSNTGAVAQVTLGGYPQFQVGMGASTNSAADGGGGWLKAVSNWGFGNGQFDIEFDFACCVTPPVVNVGNQTKQCDVLNIPTQVLGGQCDFDYGFYIAGLASDSYYKFEPGAKFTEYDNGTARFTGRIFNRSNSAIKFDLDLKFSGKSTTGTPKQECYTLNTTGWNYYNAANGTLTSVGTTAMGNFSVVINPSTTLQVGTGASLRKSDQNGASSWLDIYTATCTKYDADINVLLQCCAASATASNNGPKCTGSPVTLNVTTSNTTGTVTYAWSGPNSFTSTSQNPTVTVAGIYTVTITDGNGCKATASTTVGAFYPNPTANPTVNGNGEICEGSDAGLKSNPHGLVLIALLLRLKTQHLLSLRLTKMVAT